MIPFNKPFFAGKELAYIKQAVDSGKISGNGYFTKACQRYFEQKFNFNKVLLTASCTDALEMAALLCDIQPGDEVIMPSFTFVSTANAFVLRGAKIIFADSGDAHPNLDTDRLEELISPKTKAIVALHYGGVAADIEFIAGLVKKYSAKFEHEIFLIEDAAHAIGAYHKNIPLGSFGHFAAFSFHETKNIIAGEGGMLVINDQRFIDRAEVIWEKGTNRAAFSRHEIPVYDWIDIGSSFLPSEITAAFLFAQLEHFDEISGRRAQSWNQYYDFFQKLPGNQWFSLPPVPEHARHNHHIFFLVCRSLPERDALIAHLFQNDILAVSHYRPLHLSPYYRPFHEIRTLPNAVKFSERLLRLPLFHELDAASIDKISRTILSFYQNLKNDNLI